jgi:hypothetical protein
LAGRGQKPVFERISAGDCRMFKPVLLYGNAGTHRARRVHALSASQQFLNGMRKKIVFLTALAFAWGCAATAAQAATLSWRFAGLKAVRENKDLVTWRDVTGLPEFAGFNSNLVQRVATSLAKPLAQGGGNETDIAKALTPIAEDLIAYPTVYELTEQGASNTWALAIQIPAERHELWKSSWTGASKSPKAAGTKLNREGNWTTLANTSTKAVLDKAKLATADVLQVSGDALLLKRIVPNLKPTKTELKVTTRGKGLRSEGKAQFAEDLPIALAPWQIPTNTIREPLVGFTAIQGVSNRLAKLNAFKKHPAPSQLFIWNDRVSPFSAFVAFRVDNAKTFVQDFALSPSLAEWGKKITGNFEFDTNAYGFYLTGLPVVVPFLRPAHSNDVNFVFAGAMPTAKWNSNAIPAELTREVVTRTNLLYYDWELGFARLQQLRPLSQVVGMATGQPISNFTDPASKWLIAAESKFGNTITEVTKTGPREVSFVRSSDSGLSALEIFSFVQWVAGPPRQPLARHGDAKAAKPPKL